ncbi:hypothetical protein ARAM_002634 [Aspergillus rambellii]|uniref:DUF4291 domain-containing protein n=1 Tax=Aspergillus rambellii TaxID=308745 RepID=A0A0F8VE57_9EURO|nr:hypothetical protein ARAM_002634 [Aspergillus rambellii]
MNTHPYREIRAVYTPTTITIYQAYNAAIATAAVSAQKLVAPFKRERMTWIKPSFLWMAYRSGWATKPNQERILAIEITRAGFEWALRHSSLSHDHDRDHVPPLGGRGLSEAERQAWRREQLRRSPVRIQWDPERDCRFRPLPYRSIQVGVSGEAVDRYVDEWIVSVRDVTADMHRVKRLLDEGGQEDARRALPEEKVYPLSEELRRVLSAC